MNRYIQILVLLLFFWGCEQKISGCIEEEACNYDDNANSDDNSCFYAEDWIDECGVCDLVPTNDCVQDQCGVWGGDGLDVDNDGICDDIDECVGEFDCNGTCNGDSILDECGICGGIGPEENYDCEGNCILDVDCNGDCGGDAVVDECGVCNGDGSNCLLFTKDDFADETLSENQDCIVEHICLTRGLNQPLYNAVYYSDYSDMMASYSLGDSVLIKWAEGTVSDAELGNLTFGNSLQEISGLTTITSKDIVGYIVNLDTYLNFNFLEWTVGVSGCSDCTGGGFSYIRDIIIPDE